MPDAEAPVAPAPRRTRPIYRVFVSSTWMDLQPERRALMDALNRMEEMRFVGMEFFGNRPDDTHDASIDQVDLCEVFVGIIGHRHGSGITEAEYRRARTLGLPCFIYFKGGSPGGPEETDNDPALAAKLAAFKAELLRGHTVKEIASPEELAANATADLHNWVAARWISLEREAPAPAPPPSAPPDADRTNGLRLIERVEQDWIKGVLEASLHHQAWLELGLDWREDAVEHPWDRIVVAANRPIQTLGRQDSITGIFDAAQHTLLVLGEPGAGKTTTALELARDLIARARAAATAAVPVVLALSNWRAQQKDFLDWLVAELGLRYQVPKRAARTWLEDGRLVLILDGLDEVAAARRTACVDAINAFEQAHPPAGLAVTCRVAEYEALGTKLRLRSAICLQPLTPAQVDRYFQAAGASLEPLRHALREDAGLRELARSPLMLSVMTMAWRDAATLPVTGPAATGEERRRQLFDAYVQAALKRRGKASGGYTPEQTIRWLTWLARRMKEHGLTLFAIEQLQPSWLEGTWRQFGYFLVSRCLTTIGLVLPFLFSAGTPGATLALTGLAVFVGCYIGIIDFAMARHGWGGHRRAMLRFLVLLAGLVLLLFSWMGLGTGGAEGNGLLYLLMVGLAFCAPLDVRALDIKPAGSIQWSSRQAGRRALVTLVFLTLIVTLALLVAVGIAVGYHGAAQGWVLLGGWPYLGGLLGGLTLAGVTWRWRRPVASLENIAVAAGLVLFSGQVGGAIGSVQAGDASFWRWEAALAELWPVILLGVFGGFGSTLIDPARPQRSGVWFWLRVPVLAFLSVAGVIFIPALVLLLASWFTDSGSLMTRETMAGVTVFSAGCGLVAFLRFGGFNGAQHFLLRWLLARSGHLPPKPEPFLNHAARLALLQKVGLGYRFIHALLLQHLAAVPDGPGERGGVEPAAGTTRGAGAMLRMAAWLGLGAGLMLLAWLGAAGFALVRAKDVNSTGVLGPFLGVFMASFALAIPALLLTGRWASRVSWRWLAGGWLGLGLVVAWLAHDEPETPRPAGLAEASTAFPEAEKSYAVLARYSNGLRLPHFGLGARPVSQPFKWTGFNFYNEPGQGKIWRDFLVERRADIEANGVKLAPLRDWIAELNGFDRIADLSDDLSVYTPIYYQVLQPYIKGTTAIAGVRALAGQGDAALAELRPMLEAGGRLEVAARGEGYYENARALQLAAIQTAEFVLDNAPVSAEARARFAAALSARGGGVAGARRIFAIDYARVADASRSFGRAMTAWDTGVLESLSPVLDLAGPVAFNRHAALNRWGEMFADLQEFAARRDPLNVEQRAREFLAREGRWRFKNVGASWLNWLGSERLGLGVIAARVKAYWIVEDRRAALLARLARP